MSDEIAWPTCQPGQVWFQLHGAAQREGLKLKEPWIWVGSWNYTNGSQRGWASRYKGKEHRFSEKSKRLVPEGILKTHSSALMRISKISHKRPRMCSDRGHRPWHHLPTESWSEIWVPQKVNSLHSWHGWSDLSESKYPISHGAILVTGKTSLPFWGKEVFTSEMHCLKNKWQ
jgi:hypothetical protein